MKYTVILQALPPFMVALALMGNLCLTTASGHAAGVDRRHPYLLFTEAELPALRARFDDPAQAEVKKRLLARAERLLTYSGGGKYEGTRENFDKMSYKVWADPGMNFVTTFTWAYVLTGDKIWCDALWSVLKWECQVRGKLNQNEFRFEFMAKSNGLNAALAYDVVGPVLDAEKRQTLATYIDQYLVFKDKPSFGWKNNIGLGYFSAVGMIAMVRLDENPQARGVLAECIKRLKEVSYPVSIEPHPDGAYLEGALYADYMFKHLLPFIQRYEAVMGDRNHGLWDPAFFRNTHRMVETLVGGDGMWMSVFDSQPQPYGAAWLAALGTRTDNNLLRWAAEHYYRETIAEAEPTKEVERNLVPYVLNRSWRQEVPFPGLPTFSILPSINTGTLRSDPGLRPGLMVAVRGFGEKEVGLRGPHFDVGSFLLYARGENFLIDPGYNQPEPQNHSTLRINGQDMQARAPSPLLGDEKGERRMLTIDPSRAYVKSGKPGVELQRTWVMAGSQAVVLLDDIQGPTEVVSRFQAGFATEVQPDNRSAVIRGKSSQLWLGAYGPESQLTLSGPLDFGKSWVYKKWADEGRVAWHRLEASYKSDAGQPMVWVFVPQDPGATAPVVAVERAADRIVVRIPAQPDVIFLKSGGTWKAEGFDPQPGQT